MAAFDFTSPEGKRYTVEGPDGATQEQAFQILQTQIGVGAPAPQATAKPEKSMLENIGMGAARGVKDVIDTGAQLLSSGFDKLAGTGEGDRVRAMNEAGKAKFKEGYGDSDAASVARVGGNIAATWPVGGVLGAGAKAAGATRLGNALASGGFSTGAKLAEAPLLTKAADLGIRTLGGGATAYASGGLIDPDSAGLSGAIGASIPVVGKLAGAGGNLVASLVRPFRNRGQDRIVGDALHQYATNPNALENLRNAAPVVEGSMPTAVMAAGDEGLAGLSRTMQSIDPRYAAELSSRQAAQNAARTTALENVTGNTGKLTLAKEARDAATGPMREAVLDAAGKLPARPVLDSIDNLLSKPDNAGKIAQQALGEIRKRIAQFAPDGQIDARALYAIRKDINDTLGGKLQGEAGNLKLASGQLIEVKGLIDDAIDQASRAVRMSSGREVVPFGANIERGGAAGPFGSQGPRATWKGYLQKYTQESIPINQMEKLDEVLNAARTGTVDQSGNAVLSAAKLNNLLRNQSQELQKMLAPEQLELLRRVAGDLNASQLANNAGRAVGSNTMQNLAQSNVLASVLGRRGAESAPAQSALARILQLPYGSANKMIQEKMGAALLDPQETVRLMQLVQTPEGNKLLQALAPAAQIGYRAAPALTAQR